jgi:coenzyme F420-reducing hydrogenase delta subunit
MSEAVIFICKNCFPESASLPTQWKHGEVLVRIKIMPCSGKIDAQYMMHAMEGGVKGICVITCPEGKCKLSQGNYRAHVRTETVRRLLSEIAADRENAGIFECSGNETADSIKNLINTTVAGFTDSALAVH